MLALRLASALTPYWYFRALKPEAAGWLDAALTRDVEAAPVSVRADALAALGFHLAEPGGASERAEAAVRESLDLRRAEDDLSGCARSTQSSPLCTGMPTGPTRRTAAPAKRSGSRWRLATTRCSCGREAELAMSAPTLGEALTRGEQVSAAIARQETSGTCGAAVEPRLRCLGPRRSHDRRRLSLEALEAARALGDPYLLAFAHGNAGLAELFTCQSDRAEQAFVQELRLMGRRGYGNFVFEALNGLAAVAASHGRDRIAATLSGAADATSTMRHEPGVARSIRALLAPARGRLGEHT